VHQELHRGRVQPDSGGARDEVEEGRDLAAKRGRFHRIHGDECEIVVGAGDNALYKGGLQGSVDAVPDGNEGGGKGGAVATYEQAALSVGDHLLRGRRRRGSGWGGLWRLWRFGLRGWGRLFPGPFSNLGPGGLGRRRRRRAGSSRRWWWR